MQRSYSKWPRMELRAAGCHRTRRGSSTEPQGRSGRRPGGCLGLLWFPGVTLPEPKIRIGSDKCLTRKLLRIGADLGNYGLRKEDSVSGTLTAAQGSEASWLRGTLGKASRECFSSLYPWPEKANTIQRGFKVIWAA